MKSVNKWFGFSRFRPDMLSGYWLQRKTAKVDKIDASYFYLQYQHIVKKTAVTRITVWGDIVLI